MKNSLKKISMSVIAGTLILGNISSVGAQSLNPIYTYKTCKTVNVNKTFKYTTNCKYKGNVSIPNKKPSIPNQKPSKPDQNTDTPTNNDTTNNQNNQEQNTGSSVSAIESEVLRLVNIERSKVGVSPLKMSTELSSVARRKSQDMADKNYFSHTSPTYGSPFDMMKQFGIKYTAAGENIAKGHTSAEAVMKGWMNSQGHKDNILSPKFGTIGVGYVVKNGTTYWTQMFTN